ncbi:unnamed protein product [Camellia sinensis]
MPEKTMSISVNGQSQVPPGFRFHPTEEELLQYYLRKKVSFEKIDLDVIRDVDLNKLEPWDIQEKCRIGSTPQNDWYFFSHKDKKYPTGTRTNRATAAGFWKATGRDKVIYSNSKRIGMRKTLVFYKGRAPHGQKSDWIMHEYRLDDNICDTNNVPDATGDATQEEGWVVCRIFKKKNHHKTLDNNSSSPFNSSIINLETTRTQIPTSSDEGTLEQILHYLGRSCKKEDHHDSTINNTPGFLMPIIDTTTITKHGLHDRFMKLPSLESPNSTNNSQPCYQQIQQQQMLTDNDETGLHDWTALDRLVASHLNGQTETSKQITSCFNDPNMGFCSLTYHDLQLQQQEQQQQLRSSSSSPSNRPPFHGTPSQDENGDFDLWSFTRSSLSSTDPLCHMSNTPGVGVSEPMTHSTGKDKMVLANGLRHNMTA